jgi:hypothetical protein
MLIKILFTIIVGKLLAGLDFFAGFYVHVPAPNGDLAVGSARVINVTGWVNRRPAVYRQLWVYVKKVEAVACVGLALDRGRPTYSITRSPFL